MSKRKEVIYGPKVGAVKFKVDSFLDHLIWVKIFLFFLGQSYSEGCFEKLWNAVRKPRTVPKARGALLRGTPHLSAPWQHRR